MLIRQNIYLIGLSGSGKTTVGKILSKKLKRTFVDIDKMIERRAKKSIAQIFEDDGESMFRKLEADEFRKAARKTGRPKVIALGGGAFESSAIRKLVSGLGISIWLRCPLSELSRRLKNLSDRPLLKGNNLKPQLRAQLERRLLNYRQADLHISTAGKSPTQVSIEITKQIEKHYAAD